MSCLTNRDKYIMKVNECDMLCNIQLAMLHGFGMCIIDALANTVYPCKLNRKDNDKFKVCQQCIAEWLNKEVT